MAIVQTFSLSQLLREEGIGAPDGCDAVFLSFPIDDLAEVSYFRDGVQIDRCVLLVDDLQSLIRVLARFAGAHA